MQAIWNNTVIAESDKTIVVEGNHYFPPQSLNTNYVEESQHSSHCGWKGTARYYHIHVGGQANRDAAWYYPAPKAAAVEIKDYIAFWKGVEVR